MKILHIEKEKFVPKTKKELAKELQNCTNEWEKSAISKEKKVQMKEPVYIVEMSMEELQLVSFYLELEKRKPIVNIDITKE